MNFGLPGINNNQGFTGASDAVDVKGNATLRKFTLSENLDLSARNVLGQGITAQGQRDLGSIRSVWFEMDAFQPGIVTRETLAGQASFTREYLEQKIKALYSLGFRRFISQSININGRTYTRWTIGYPIDADGTQLVWWYASVSAGVKPFTDDFDILEFMFSVIDRLEGASLVVGFGQHGDPLLLQDIYNVIWSGGPMDPDPMRFGITVAARLANEVVRYQAEAANVFERYGGHVSFGGWFIGHETTHLQASVLLYQPIIQTSGARPALNTYGCDTHFSAFHPTDLANTTPIAQALIDTGATWVWPQTSALYGYRYATGLNSYVGSVTVANVGPELATWRAVIDTARGMAGGADAPYLGVQVENSRIGQDGTTTLTLSATTVGVGRTVSSSAPVSPIWVVGQELNGRAGQATGLGTITLVTDSQNCTIEITEAFTSTTVAANLWSIYNIVDIVVDAHPAPASEMLTEIKTESLYCDDISISAEPYFDPGTLSLVLKQSQAGIADYQTLASDQWNEHNVNLTTAGHNIMQAGWDPAGYIGALSVVTGPSSATNNAIAKFNGTTGKIIQNSGVAIDGSQNLTPVTTDVGALGTTTLQWADAFFASGSVINWDAGDVTLTHGANILTFAGATSGYLFNTGPLRLPAAGALNWNAGGVTITEASDSLVFNGASAGYFFSHVVAPAADDGAPLGTSVVRWSDLFLASGGVINWANSDATITHSTGLLTTNVPLTVTGVATADGFAPTATTATGNRMYLPAANTLGWAINGTGELQLTATALSPIADGGNSLGTTALGWQNLFLATGAVINFNNGDVTITHSANTLAFAGASSGYTFDVPIAVTSGGTGAATAATARTNLGMSGAGVQPGVVYVAKLTSADFNVTTDQAIVLTLPFQKYRINAILVGNGSTSLTTAQGGFYTAASKAGTAIVAAGQAYTTVTGATAIQACTIAAAASALILDATTNGTIYLSLTTPQGSAATADVWVYVQALP